MDKLVLGGAQFLTNYGLTRPNVGSEKDAIELVDAYCMSAKYPELDTSILYGAAYGFATRQHEEFGKIYIKLPVRFFPEKVAHKFELLLNHVARDFGKAKVSIIIHDFDEISNLRALLAVEQIHEWAMKHKMKISVGISAYDIQRAFEFYVSNEHIVSELNLPINILLSDLDRQLLKVLKNKPVNIIARSVFLQGLLVNDRLENLTGELAKFHQEWHFALPSVQDRIAACLGVATEFADRVVLGFDRVEELKQVIAITPVPWDRAIDLMRRFEGFRRKTIADPRAWIL